VTTIFETNLSLADARLNQVVKRLPAPRLAVAGASLTGGPGTSQPATVSSTFWNSFSPE
jgi:hypothetical protein